MKNIIIPETAETHQADLLQRAFPDQTIAQNDFYRRMIGWIIDNRTPVLYEQTHSDETANLSINFNWLLLRDYEGTNLGSPDTMLSLYSLHEFAHMTHWLPTNLGKVAAGQYAEQFTGSEYRASNESEILAHYRMPGLRAQVFPGVRIAVDILKEQGIEQPPSQLLNKVRALLVEHSDFDHMVGDDPDAQAQLARLKSYGGNRQWAAAHYEAIRDRFNDPDLPLGHGLTDAEYEPILSAYEPSLSQEQYQTNIIRNVRFAYAMCGLEVPLITSFTQARELAAALEGRHALITEY